MLAVRPTISASLLRTRPLCCVLKKYIGYSNHETAAGAPEPIVDDSDDIRNVSRLPRHLRVRLEKNAGPMQFDEVVYPQGHTRAVMRRWYARHGKKTGIDPSIAFPTKEELRDILQDELEFEPSLQERWATVEAQKAEETEKRRKHEEHVTSQMAKMPQYIAQYKKKLLKEQDELKKLEAKKNALLEEARDYYGYRIDDKDPRFHQLQEKKEEEEQAEKKKRKKEEKKAKAAEALRRLTSR